MRVLYYALRVVHKYNQGSTKQEDRNWIEWIERLSDR